MINEGILYKSVFTKDIEKIQRDFSIIDDQNIATNCLKIAVEQNCLELVKHFCSFADIAADDHYILHYSLTHKQTDIFAHLWQEYNTRQLVGQLNLMQLYDYCVLQNQPNELKYIIQCIDFPIQNHFVFVKACDNNFIDIVSIILPHTNVNYKDCEALQTAMYAEHIDVVKLLTPYCDLYVDNCQLFKYALWCQQIETINTFLPFVEIELVRQNLDDPHMLSLFDDICLKHSLLDQLQEHIDQPPLKIQQKRKI